MQLETVLSADDMIGAMPEPGATGLIRPGSYVGYGRSDYSADCTYNYVGWSGIGGVHL